MYVLVGRGLGEAPPGIKILVRIWINSYRGALPITETLIIDKLSLLSKGAGPPSVGRWTSRSKYLGRTSSGNYLLRNWHLEKFGPGRGGSLADPVGWFVDSANWEAPFLILSNFDKAKGIGRLQILDPALPSQGKEYVEWFKVG
jgi:hypothetical protein